MSLQQFNLKNQQKNIFFYNFSGNINKGLHLCADSSQCELNKSDMMALNDLFFLILLHKNVSVAVLLHRVRLM